MKTILSIGFFVWIVISSALLVSTPIGIRLACKIDCPSAESISKIVNGKSEQVPAELDFLAVSLQKDVFTLDEESHLIDVSRLLLYIKLLWIFLSLALIKLRKYLTRKVILSSIILGSIISGIVGVMAVANWHLFFESFHKVFFPQGNWSFPEESGLITIFPEDFWQRMAALIGALVCSMYAAVFSFSKRLRRE